jgi:hypothetical protein
MFWWLWAWIWDFWAFFEFGLGSPTPNAIFFFGYKCLTVVSILLQITCNRPVACSQYSILTCPKWVCVVRLPCECGRALRAYSNAYQRCRILARATVIFPNQNVKIIKKYFLLVYLLSDTIVFYIFQWITGRKRIHRRKRHLFNSCVLFLCVDQTCQFPVYQARPYAIVLLCLRFLIELEFFFNLIKIEKNRKLIKQVIWILYK